MVGIVLLNVTEVFCLIDHVWYVSSSLIGGSQLFNTLSSVMLSIAVLTNEMCIVWSESCLLLPATVTQFGYVK